MYIFKFKMFHQEASVGIIKLIKTACLAELTEYYCNVLVKTKKASNHICFSRDH